MIKWHRKLVLPASPLVFKDPPDPPPTLIALSLKVNADDDASA
jgi:hypothetical protein